MAKSANQILFDRAVRHAIFLERYKNNEVDKIVGFLNRDVLPDITKQVQERYEGIASARRTVSARRLKSLQVAVRGEITGGMLLISKQLKKDLRALGVEESLFQVSAFESAVRPIVIDFNLPSVVTLNQIVTREPILGQTLNGWFNKNIRDANDAIMGQVRIGLAQGEAVDTIVKRLRGTAGAAFGDGTYNQIRNHMRTLVRTSATHVSAQAREATYDANDDLVKGVQYVATLDSRTTDICASLDGQVFPINEGERPPQHHQCLPGDSLVLSRSRITGIFKRWFEGEMVAIQTVSGRKLTATSNHPVLTNNGWIRIGSLQVGDIVICDGGDEWKTPSCDNGDKYNLSSIRDAVKLFIEHGLYSQVILDTDRIQSSSGNIIRNDTELADNILAGSFGSIFLDEIIDAKSFDFAGYVYNLQTNSNFYSASGIIVHNCRSTTVPVLKSFKELGIPAKDLPQTTRAARNAETKLSGRVPARQTYPEWLRSQSAKTQNMALGPTRAKLFRDGKLTIDRFINDSGKRLSLKNLALKEGLPPIKVVRTPKPKSRK